MEKGKLAQAALNLRPMFAILRQHAGQVLRSWPGNKHTKLRCGVGLLFQVLRDKYVDARRRTEYPQFS